MRGFLLLPLLLLIASTTTHAFRANRAAIAPNCIKQHGRLLPMAGSCSGFYICYNGMAIEQSCGNYLKFNAHSSICDHPDNVKCGKQQKPVQPIKPKSGICEGVANDTLLPHSSDCGRFFSCSNARAVTMRCPAGLHFSVAHNRCDWPWAAKCQLKK